jgi:mono/diheme cytochrome c family protein
METRFLIKRCESGACRAAWEGYSYQWNDDATEATLLDNTNLTIFKDWPSGGSMHRHSYPGRGECTQCHVNVAGGVLGLQTVQMNRNFDYGGAVDNQLRALGHAGVFGGGPSMDGGVPPDGGASIDSEVPPDGGVSPGAGFPFGSLDGLPRLPTPGDVAYSVNERVRSYFHSNCSHCHRPDGRWPVINLLYDAPLIGAKQPNHNICDELVPGDAESSRLFIKDSARLGNLPPDFFGLPMPPLATLLPDQRQLPTLKAWINQMETCP